MRRIPWLSADRAPDITVLEDDRGLVIHIPANITVKNADQICASVVSAWRQRGKPRRLVLNLREVKHIDSSGMGMLIELAHKANAENVPFVLCGLQPSPRRMLERTGLMGWFAVFPTVEQALESGTLPATPAAPMTPTVKYLPPLPPRRSFPSTAKIWTLNVLLAAVIVGAAAYGYWTLGGYTGKLDQVPGIQNVLAATGKRVDAAEESLRNWTSEREVWARRFTQMGNQVNAARKQSSDTAAQTAALGSRMDATDQRLANLEDQVDRIDPNIDVSGQADRLPPDRERIDFEVGVSRERELAPGIKLIVSRTDVAGKSYDGRVWLEPDRRALVVRGQALGQPLYFYSHNDAQPLELVVTGVTPDGASGYLLEPKPAAPGSGLF